MRTTRATTERNELMKKSLQKSWNFVKRHNEAVVVAVIATLAITQQHKSIKALNEFLDQKGLTDEYYTVE